MTSEMLMDQDRAIAASVALTRQAHADFAGQVRVLNDRLAGVGAIFQGQAAASWLRVLQAWNDQVSRLLGALQQFGDDLETSDRTFQATDDQAAQSLSRLGARLG